MKKTILYVSENRAALTFLESFFRGSRTYRSLRFDSVEKLISSPLLGTASALIADTKLLPLIRPRPAELPLVALAVGSSAEGVEAAFAQKAELCLRKPYLAKELEQQLRTLLALKESEEALRHEIRDLQTINEFRQLISSSLDSKTILYRIVKKIAEIMPVTRCSIIRIDWLHKYAYVVASYENPDLMTIKLSLRKYPEISEALLNKQPVIIRDIASDPLMNPVRDMVAPLGIRSIMVMPILFEDKVIGTVFLRTSRTQHQFSEKEIQLIRTISDASANTLFNAFRFEQMEDEKTRLEKLAITDFLTGIYNIRYFYHRLIEEFSRSERYALPVCCLMIDIDFFKKINDSLGHRTGDAVLKEFAQLLKKHVRKSDVLARYGGEEFIVMLPQTMPAGAVAEAERIRSAVSRHRFKGLGEGIGLTVSIGISVYPHERIKSHDDLISTADDALYEAKKDGRDRVKVSA